MERKSIPESRARLIGKGEPDEKERHFGKENQDEVGVIGTGME